MTPRLRRWWKSLLASRRAAADEAAHWVAWGRG
jgi:hypothetical protein